MKTIAFPGAFKSTFGLLKGFLSENGINIYYINENHGVIKAYLENKVLQKFKSIDVELMPLKNQLTRLNFWVHALISFDYPINKTEHELTQQSILVSACKVLEEKLFNAIQVELLPLS